MPVAGSKKKAHGTRKKARSKKPRRLSRTHQPEDMQLNDWQVGLRRQFARQNQMFVKNLGADPVFSEYAVTNPETSRTYRVVIRGQQLGVNYCSCPDYAVNTLGTCKHIEATLVKLQRKYRRKLNEAYCPRFAEVYVQYGSQRNVVFSAGQDAPAELLQFAAEYFDEQGLIKPGSHSKFDEFVRATQALEYQTKIYDDAMSLIAEVRDGLLRDKTVQQQFGRTKNASRWKSLLHTTLYPYQQEGALFAARSGRAIIADEMGLGKTVQALAAAEILARCGMIERVLIICPASLKHQWSSEIARFSHRPAQLIEGLSHRRREIYKQDGAFFKIVNYDVVHRDLQAIANWAPDLVILDEAQRIKNWQTRAAKSVKQIDSPYAIVLTGTPLENRLEELHSIVEFVDRHCLGPLFAFKAAHEIREEDSTKVVGYRDLQNINQTLASILIRRQKKDVLKQLPPRMDKNFFVPMTKEQWVPHQENREIVARLVSKWNRYRFLSEQDQLRLRIALQYMRMACDSTYLVDHRTKHGTKVDELKQLLDEVFETPRSKVVIFSQWVRMNELVSEMLEDQRWGHVHLHGGVPSRSRKNLIEDFRGQEDCRVFLSTDAGGVGLNLQSAATVINMDLPWNPAVLEQRIGRVHRLGQRQSVRVVNFISQETIEHGMLSLLAFKQSMFTGVLDGTSDKVFMGESALSRFMKTVETATGNVPEETPRTQVSEDAEQTMSDEPELDMDTLGGWLQQGANFLQKLSQSLTSVDVPVGAHDSRSIQPRIVEDPASGKRELRVTLPEPETIQRWLGQLSELFRA